MNDTDTDDTPSPIYSEFWDSLGDKPFGCTPQQVAFARHYVESQRDGAKPLPAYVIARMAGYQGDDKQLSVQGSRLLRNEKVRRLIDAALSASEAEIEGAMLPDELVRLLEKQARYGQTVTERISSQKILAEYFDLKGVTGNARPPEAMFDFVSSELCRAHPIGTAAAVVLAKQLGFGPGSRTPWRPSAKHVETLQRVYPEIAEVLRREKYDWIFTPSLGEGSVDGAGLERRARAAG